MKKTLEHSERVKKRIPGMSQLLSKRPDMFSLGVWPGFYEKAKGAEVWDLDGNRYLDMSISGIGANVLGYADPDVNAAVIEAISKGSSCSLNSPEELELADVLCELHPWAHKARFTRCGGEAMSVAVRIARAFSGKDIVAVCGYHGWHDWYLAANLGTENALGEHLIPGLSPVGVPKSLTGTILTFRYNHIEDLEDICFRTSGQLAAIVMEPIRSIQPLPGFLNKVKELARRNNAVFILDEISSGFRMNTGGAHALLDITPDLAVFSKAMGNGFPIAAIIGRDEVMEAAQLSFISSTMWTERVGPTAALATIKKHRENNTGEHLMRIGKMMQEGWVKTAGNSGVDISVGGIYPLSHFKFEYPNALALKAFFIQEMIARGLLASTTFYPMLAHQEEHVSIYLKAAEEVFSLIQTHLKRGDIESFLKGKPSQAGFKRVT